VKLNNLYMAATVSLRQFRAFCFYTTDVVTHDKHCVVTSPKSCL